MTRWTIFLPLWILISCNSKELNIKKADRQIDGIKGNVQMVMQEFFYADSSTNRTSRKNYSDLQNFRRKYNEQGNETEFIGYKLGDSIDFKSIIRYDAEGNDVEKSFYNSFDSIYAKFIIKHSDKKIEVIEYQNKDSIGSKDIYYMDSRGNRIKWEHFSSSNSLDFSQEYQYDNNNHRTGVKLSEGNSIKKWTYLYDDSNNRTEIKEYKDNKLRSIIKYKFDEEGNETELSVFTADNKLLEHFTYKYSYDDVGNWIKKIEKSNGTSKNIWTRHLDYYK